MDKFTYSYIENLDSHYVMNTYTRNPLLLEQGKGVTLCDSEGKTYLDFGAGIGVASIGYGDRAWVKSVSRQVARLAHTSNLYYNETCARLAEKICNTCNMDRVFFGNSGAEANEGAIKLARKYSFDKYGEGRNRIIALNNSFHGRTVTTLSATGQDFFHQYFFPFTEGFDFAPVNNIEALKDMLDESVCAIMVEPIQGEGGVLPLDEDYYRAVRALCDEKDILLIADEVQTGVGRSGRFLCSDCYGVHPDIVTLAKGLAGGLPIGAVICCTKLRDVMGKSSHGSTFGGNPVSCAGGLAVMDKVAKDSFLKTVAKNGDYLMKKLRALGSPHIRAVRGRGLMVGVELDGVEVGELLVRLRELGLLALSAKTCLRLLPPLIVTKRDIDRAVSIIGVALASFDEPVE